MSNLFLWLSLALSAITIALGVALRRSINLAGADGAHIQRLKKELLQERDKTEYLERKQLRDTGNSREFADLRRRYEQACTELRDTKTALAKARKNRMRARK